MNSELAELVAKIKLLLGVVDHGSVESGESQHPFDFNMWSSWGW